jgi:hypothetical protein
VKRILIGRLIQKIQHSVPALYLLGEGLRWLREGAGGWYLALAGAEIVTASAVVLLLIKEARHVRKTLALVRANEPPVFHFGVDAIDLWLGAMCFTEVWAHWMESGHIRRPTVLLGIVLIALGLWGGKIYRRRLVRKGVIG